MSVNCRFALDEKRNVIDAVNVANSGKAYCHEGAPEDDKYLRERVLMIRLSGMIEKLITNLRPMQKLPSGEEYKPVNEESRSIWLALLDTISASHLNTFDPTMSIQHISSTGNSDARRDTRRISHPCRFFAMSLNVFCATCTATSKARRWTALYGPCSVLLKRSRNMCARIFGKSIRTPRTLTTCLGSVCQKDVGLAAGSGAAEWQQNTI